MAQFGFVLVFASGFLRVWCYRTLGRLFTYELSVQPGHKLITSGPYGIVRHPSYTGLIANMSGAGLMIVAPGSYLVECGAISAKSRWLVYAWLAFLAWGCSVFVRRGKVEDQVMKAQFGREWETYRDRYNPIKRRTCLLTGKSPILILQSPR
ncbi:hypothetical protein Clacol_009550 [Clathrus columnatus]|uniref:Protein-S-isoprenylcysteine O-methyltransferase n=1 Tax=Clathrus columnatus TaxID=1419009 RepID=A0AAV5AQ42_9AGAM|nr:hypothetical protein Clacol_009550 [Clathrus columnatus]